MVKHENNFQGRNLTWLSARIQRMVAMNKPGRRSNPIPTHPEEDEDEPAKPGKTDPAKKKKKKSIYEVTY